MIIRINTHTTSRMFQLQKQMHALGEYPYVSLDAPARAYYMNNEQIEQVIISFLSFKDRIDTIVSGAARILLRSGTDTVKRQCPRDAYRYRLSPSSLCQWPWLQCFFMRQYAKIVFPVATS